MARDLIFLRFRLASGILFVPEKKQPLFERLSLDCNLLATYLVRLTPPSFRLERFHLRGKRPAIAYYRSRFEVNGEIIRRSLSLSLETNPGQVIGNE